jgi:hypothetical protein
MFSALIKEISNSAFLNNENGCFYIKDENVIYNGNCQELLSLEEDQSPYYFEGNFWFGDYYADESFTVDNKGLKLHKPFFFDHGTLLNKEHFYRTKSRRVHGLEQYNFSGELVKKIEGRLRYLIQSADLLFVLGKGALLAYDFDLNKKWQVSTTKSCFSGVPNSMDAPQYYKASDLVIINFGEHDTPERGEFEINAYQAETGALVWQQIVSTSPSCSHLSGDKVYVCVDDELIILAAATGEVLHRVKHQLNEPSDGYPPVNFMYPYQDKLLLVSPKQGLVQLRTSDAKTILQNIHVPLPYTTSFHPPVLHDDKVYFSLTHANSFNNTMKGGILVLTQDKNIESNADEIVEVNIEARPPMTVTLVKGALGQDVYQVTIDHDNLDDIIRFSTIALKEVAFRHGKYSSATDTNKNHHGQLLLKVNRQGLKISLDELSQKLAIIKQRVEDNLISSRVKAGDGKNSFVVDIELV